jgi:hypothetical protein
MAAGLERYEFVAHVYLAATDPPARPRGIQNLAQPLQGP